MRILADWIRSGSWWLVLLAVSACGFPASPKRPRETAPPAPHPSLEEARAAWADAERIFQSRCVVCHGCYDAPCQLKLESFEGLERGANEHPVYDTTRLTAAPTTRLGIDAHGVAEWREKGFHAVLAEGNDADPRSGVLYRMLALKERYPISASRDLAKDFTFELDRKQVCTAEDRFRDYVKEHPLWGMPYGLPGLSTDESRSLEGWLAMGAPHSEPEPATAAISAAITKWEAFLNDATPKRRLAARYIFEHLFLATLYFDGPDAHTYFRLVRSRTPIGPVVEVKTRRPFDDPGAADVYYRFVRRSEPPLAKTYMPYALSDERLARYEKWFVEPAYDVTALPTYEPAVASNPFRAFRAIPIESRYRFMLDEAEFVLMGFIKGPVCRGQVALDVIQDRFWITFLRPDVKWMDDESTFLSENRQELDMPAEVGSTASPLSWLRYGDAHDRYVAKKNDFMRRATKGGTELSTKLIWDGDGKNGNLALTVFRHFNSASVVRGLVGEPPKTAWVIDYPLLERIHYLLVAGFDVFGNVGHQLTTRLYMDYLRMEGEANFLLFLPPERRKALADFWYRGLNGKQKDRVYAELTGYGDAPRIHYESARPEDELFGMLEARVGALRFRGHDVDAESDTAVRAALKRLTQVTGKAASLLPETSFVMVSGNGADGFFTVLRDSAHTNVTDLFDEKSRRVESEDRLSAVPGLLGAYPNALFDVPREALDAFVTSVEHLDTAAAYAALRSRFGIARNSDGFWQKSDRLQSSDRAAKSSETGIIDYSRLDAK